MHTRGLADLVCETEQHEIEAFKRRVAKARALYFRVLAEERRADTIEYGQCGDPGCRKRIVVWVFGQSGARRKFCNGACRSAEGYARSSGSGSRKAQRARRVA